MLTSKPNQLSGVVVVIIGSDTVGQSLAQQPARSEAVYRTNRVADALAVGIGQPGAVAHRVVAVADRVPPSVQKPIP